MEQLLMYRSQRSNEKLFDKKHFIYHIPEVTGNLFVLKGIHFKIFLFKYLL